ncbi:hypothetical protein J2Z44_004280 [Clostridium punense]|uniref:Uncharacterized protein n=1 Tax=Clostridium punense TaxID=1054297 RepID=A0ABS4KAY1_9CLOT|nr:hypothetical protein [Clostridium punense]
MDWPFLCFYAFLSEEEDEITDYLRISLILFYKSNIII